MTATCAAPAGTVYTSRACKGSALLGEMRALLRAWHPGEPAAQLERRALDADLLGKATAHRVYDVVRRVFAVRFIDPPGCPARNLKRLVEARPAGDWFRHLALLYAARADAVLRDGVVCFYRRAAAEGRLRLGTQDAVDFLQEAERAGVVPYPWSPSVRERVAQGLLRQLTEYGLLGEPARGFREMLRFRPDPLAVAYLAFDLHFAGATDAGVVAHPDWRLWQLEEPDARHALDDLSRHGLWIFQAAGSVVRISWRPATMEEAVDALARLDL